MVQCSSGLKKDKELLKTTQKDFFWEGGQVKSFTHGSIRRGFVDLVKGLEFEDNCGFGNRPRVRLPNIRREALEKEDR